MFEKMTEIQKFETIREVFEDLGASLTEVNAVEVCNWCDKKIASLVKAQERAKTAPKKVKEKTPEELEKIQAVINKVYDLLKEKEEDDGVTASDLQKAGMEITGAELYRIMKDKNPQTLEVTRETGAIKRNGQKEVAKYKAYRI